jgi:hypothetical protein
VVQKINSFVVRPSVGKEEEEEEQEEAGAAAAASYSVFSFFLFHFCRHRRCRLGKGGRTKEVDKKFSLSLVGFEPFQYREKSPPRLALPVSRLQLPRVKARHHAERGQDVRR